ncbi:MAG: HIT domain-containing protein [Puniceicoccales bacterium]|jgi:histidine triad (HIT) family protein|nr:HIT domain-containing protein [Puniceicoccales bacterium]
MEEKTIFEKIIGREIDAEILFENERAIIIGDIDPQAPVHVLIIPKRKISRIGEINGEDADLIGELMLLAKNFATASNLESFRLVINSGKQAGETVPHLHIHLLSGRQMAWPPG